MSLDRKLTEIQMILLYLLNAPRIYGEQYVPHHDNDDDDVVLVAPGIPSCRDGCMCYRPTQSQFMTASMQVVRYLRSARPQIINLPSRNKYMWLLLNAYAWRARELFFIQWTVFLDFPTFFVSE